jgi:hypothetical protein
MQRRAFLASSAAAALVPPGGTAASPTAAGDPPPGPAVRPRVLELRRYQLRFGPMEARLAAYVKDALVPALGRASLSPIGVFSVLFGPGSPSTWLLLPHPSAESVVALDAKLEADAEYRRAAASFRALPASDPPYVRVDSSLLVPFETMPEIEPPAGANAGPGRVFELRTYESPSEAAGRKKIEMFEAAGEIGIFRRVGLTPVFFGRGLVGTGLPKLTYMLVFPDLAKQEKQWAVFRDDPQWQKLRATPGFANADVLSSIDVQVLRPTEASQI